MTTTLTKIEKRIDILEEQQPRPGDEPRTVIFLPDDHRNGPIDYEGNWNQKGQVRVYIYDPKHRECCPPYRERYPEVMTRDD